LTQDDTSPREWRIDDLAQISGVPTRTIRFYNTQGLLPSPRIRGRVAFYGPEHLLILGIIRELKEQQNLPLDIIKHLLEIRAQHGDVQMNLALKRRLLRSIAGGTAQVHLTRDEMTQQSPLSAAQVAELVEQGLLFPFEDEGQQVFTGDDVLLAELYQRLEQLGLPIALPALIRFQLRQLVRSEIAACEQYLLPQWREAELPLEQQTARFEDVLTLTDTLISILHRKLLYRD
jgi:DNA-binding transcriptional MerR regulator